MCLGRCVFPRRPDPEAADDAAVVERPPRVFPAVGDLVAPDAEALAQLVLADGIGVDREAAVDLLDSLRKQIEQLCELELAAGDDDASQRNALLSFSNKPSSGL
jgi:hypothetical protein